MALWNEKTPVKPAAPSFLANVTEPVVAPRVEHAPIPEPKPEPVVPRAIATPKGESLIAPDLAIEGKIEGSGHVRIAGKFKGDVDVRGDLTIESGAKVTGSVRAHKIVIAGELIGNIEAASHVDLVQSGSLTGDLKAGSLTVAAGSRMRGQADFGWEDSKPDASPRKNGGAD